MTKTKRVNLKCRRIKFGLTQVEISEKLGVSKWSYIAVENGRRNGSKELWENIQKVLEVDDAEMWGLQKLS